MDTGLRCRWKLWTVGIDESVDGASEWKMWMVVVIVVVGCVCGFWMRIRMVDMDVDADEGRKGGEGYI